MGNFWHLKEIVKEVEGAWRIAPKSVNGDADIVASSGSLFSIRDCGGPFGMLLISELPWKRMCYC